MLVIWFLILLVSFYFLARISDEYFIVSLEKIAGKYNMSSDMTGATLMAIGSSSPELFVSLASLLKPGNHAAVGVGTIVGSALFNILVIIGVSSVVRTAVVSWQPIVRDSFFYAVSVFLLLLFFKDGVITIYESVIFIGTYIFYVFVVLHWKGYFPYKDEESEEREEGPFGKEGESRWLHERADKLLEKILPNDKRYYSVFFLSVLYIGFLSWLLVESAVSIAQILQVPEVIIALTILAIGTSIPDLVSSYLVAKRGKSSMAISNAVGSNIFDILIGLGLPFFLVIGVFQKDIVVSTSDLYFTIILLIGSVLGTFFIFLLRKWRVDYKTGYLLIGVYLLYIIWTIVHVS